jgi:hypothetical protein
LRTHLLFFPLWLGYALLVDALVLRQRGTSILTRSPKDFALLFVYSAPAWWLFEAFNLRTHNWHYLGGERFSPLAYFFLTSLSFSTVMRDGCAVSQTDRASDPRRPSCSRCCA